MKIKIKVNPNSRAQSIKEIEKGFYHIHLKSPAKENKANYELIKFIEKYFKKRAKIKSGFNSKIKIIELED